MTIDRDAPVIASAEVYVDAPPATVWAVQADLAGWPAWNADVTAIDLRGPLAPGTEFRWKAGGLPITSRLLAVDRERRIGWTGRAPLGIRAVHVWTFAPEGSGTRVRTEESFDGLLARLLSGAMRRMLEATLEKGASGLKAECERRSAAAAG